MKDFPSSGEEAKSPVPEPVVAEQVVAERAVAEHIATSNSPTLGLLAKRFSSSNNLDSSSFKAFLRVDTSREWEWLLVLEV